jgi:hypothetical protein
VIAAIAPAQARAQDWPAPFDPTQVLTVELEMAPSDWDTIRHDTTNEIEVPAMFKATGDEEAILVSVRRKSSRALPSESDPIKIGMKVDINEYVDQKWRMLTKLSLENGSDEDPVSEGFAWNLHELAWAGGYYGGSVHAGLASWVRVYVNGDYLGVYVNAEERDKQFLKNRNLWFPDQTWIYEIDDIDGFELEEGDPHSPTYNLLCFSPFNNFKNPKPCATPSDASLATLLPVHIDMQSMLTQGDVHALSSNGDALFTHGKNFRHVDRPDPTCSRAASARCRCRSCRPAERLRPRRCGGAGRGVDARLGCSGVGNRLRGDHQPLGDSPSDRPNSSVQPRSL